MSGITFDEAVDRILDEDDRYAREAYVFVQLALDFWRRHHGEEETRHITGPQLCVGVRDLALAQYGPFAPEVLGHWGVGRGEDVGEIVYNLIRHGMMSRSEEDRREDFHGVMEYDESMATEHRW